MAKTEFTINRKTGAKSLTKDQFITEWYNTQDNLPLKPRVVEYKHEGTTIDEDGIRVTGSYDFCLAVASRLKDLIDMESSQTRLQVSFSETVCRETGRPMGSFRLAIQVHERGPAARMTFFYNQWTRKRS